MAKALRLGTPVWLDGRHRRQTYPPLRGSHDVDLAIVGGGITGSAVAALFARAGISVGLVEADLVARGSTAASTALLLREPDLGLIDLGRRYGASRARRIWQLSAGAASDFVRTLRRLDIACELTRRDSVYYTTSPASVPDLKAEHSRRSRAGFASEWLAPGPFRRLTGIAGRGAVKTRNNAQFDPVAASLGLLGTAARAGARVFERSRVRRIDTTKDGVQVVTSTGTLNAAQVVIATGYATPGFEPLVGRFALNHTYVLATRPLSQRERRDVGLGDVMLWDTERPYHYVRWTADHRLLLGGSDRPLMAGARRIAAFRRGTAQLREYFETLLPALTDIGIDFAWEGLFANTPDSLPYIGPHARYPRHLFALGYGGNGMTFGFLAARMLLEQWRGIDSPDHALFAFGRHRRRRGDAHD
jgi:glycine/D-amino acid oxidase-like deaminating enzyme